MSKIRESLKKGFDLAAGLTGAIICAIPVTCVALTMSKITNNSPFFLQTRIGKDGKPFKIYKIRTMRDEFNEQGNLLPDPERTPALGALLRKTRFDELPQFFNVIKGDMSIVGPRPQPLHQPLADDSLRHQVRPGMTGLAQSKGANLISYAETLKLDHEYVLQPSLRRDFAILLETPVRIILNMNKAHYREERNMTRHV